MAVLSGVITPVFVLIRELSGHCEVTQTWQFALTKSKWCDNVNMTRVERQIPRYNKKENKREQKEKKIIDSM